MSMAQRKAARRPSKMGIAAILLGVLLQLGAIVGVFAWAEAGDTECDLLVDEVLFSQLRRCDWNDWDEEPKSASQPIWPLGVLAGMFAAGVALHRRGLKGKSVEAA